MAFTLMDLPYARDALAPNGGGKPRGDVSDAIDESFGNVPENSAPADDDETAH